MSIIYRNTLYTYTISRVFSDSKIICSLESALQTLCFIHFTFFFYKYDAWFQKELDRKWKEENKCILQTFISLKQVFYVVVCLSMFDNNILICADMQKFIMMSAHFFLVDDISIKVYTNDRPIDKVNSIWNSLDSLEV